MKCPRCGKQIEFVNVYSPCVQRGTLKGKTIVDYTDTEVLQDTTGIECPECCEDIREFVKQT
jgi:DNA-directed RNA polymerase subunit RPC12/RpoP